MFPCYLPKNQSNSQPIHKKNQSNNIGSKKAYVRISTKLWESVRKKWLIFFGSWKMDFFYPLYLPRRCITTSKWSGKPTSWRNRSAASWPENGSCPIVQWNWPLWKLEACSGRWIWKLYSNTCPSNWWSTQFWSVQQAPWSQLQKFALFSFLIYFVVKLICQSNTLFSACRRLKPFCD